MNLSSTLPEGFVRHTSARGGVFTTASARHHGVGSNDLRAAVAEGAAHRIVPGVYSLRPTPDVDSRIWAGLLHVGPHATLGGPAAAFVRGQGPEPDVIDIWTGHRTLKDRLNWALHPGSPPPREVPDDVGREFAVLATARTLDRDAVVAGAQRLLRLADRERLLALAEHDRLEGRSVAESLFVQQVELRHGLPRSVWQGPDSGGVLRTRFPEFNVTVVIDAARDRDAAAWRDPEHEVSYADEDIVLDIGWWGLTAGACHTGRKVAELLWRSGWMGVFPRCSSCNVEPFVPRSAPLHHLHADMLGALR